MELKKGYKHSEVGIIPEDWNLALIPHIISKKDGIKIGPFGSQLKKDLLTTIGYKVYGQENVYEKNMNIGNRFINKEHFEKLKTCEIKGGDFLISMMGTIGKTMIVPNGIETGIMDSHLLRLKLNNKIIYSELLQHYFTSNIILNQVINLSVGGIMNGLSSKIIKSILVPIPLTIKEQTEIATILTDTDKLTNSIEKLIEKKKAIKQGAMQKLLQPKEGWEVKKLGEVVNLSSGESPSKFEFIESGIPYFKVEQLNNGSIYACKTEYFINHENPIPAGSIIFPKRGASIFQNKIRVLKYPSYMDTNLMTITPCNEVSNMYIYYALVNIGLDQVADTTSIPQINNKHILPFELSFPKNIEEQINISTILSDMDNEIQVLESKLSKYQLIKHGMMQKLLTGKIRLTSKISD